MNAATPGADLVADLVGDRDAVEHAVPVIRTPPRASELLQRIRPPEHDELVAGADGGVRLGIELHPPVLPLNADDDHAEPLPQVRLDDRRVRQRRRRRAP